LEYTYFTGKTLIILQLASEVPPAVLADIVDLSPSTAMKWVEWAGGNWIDYVTLRKARQFAHGSHGGVAR
jgi:hypothetical protein